MALLSFILKWNHAHYPLNRQLVVAYSLYWCLVSTDRFHAQRIKPLFVNHPAPSLITTQIKINTKNTNMCLWQHLRTAQHTWIQMIPAPTTWFLNCRREVSCHKLNPYFKYVKCHDWGYLPGNSCHTIKIPIQTLVLILQNWAYSWMLRFQHQLKLIHFIPDSWPKKLTYNFKSDGFSWPFADLTFCQSNFLFWYILKDRKFSKCEGQLIRSTAHWRRDGFVLGAAADCHLMCWPHIRWVLPVWNVSCSH